MFRQLTDFVTKEKYLQDVYTHTDYRQVACALAWPWSPSPGCVVVLAERRAAPQYLGEDRHIDVKAETISHSEGELIESVARLMTLFRVPYVIADVGDERVSLIDHENDLRRSKRERTLRLQSPYHWEGRGERALPYYVALLRRRIVDAKTLHFSQLSQIPMDAQRVLGTDDTLAATFRLQECPSLCALCWALDALTTQDPEGSIPYDRVLSGPVDAIGGV